jgi:hypothetical protein
VGSAKISEGVLMMIPTEAAFAPHRSLLQMHIRPKVERLSRNSMVKGWVKANIGHTPFQASGLEYLCAQMFPLGNIPIKP